MVQEIPLENGKTFFLQYHHESGRLNPVKLLLVNRKRLMEADE